MNFKNAILWRKVGRAKMQMATFFNWQYLSELLHFKVSFLAIFNRSIINKCPY